MGDDCLDPDLLGYCISMTRKERLGKRGGTNYFYFSRPLLCLRCRCPLCPVHFASNRIPRGKSLVSLCISQLQLRPAPPPRATAGHFPALSVPGVGHLQILHCPGAGHLPTPGPFPSFWHARGFLSEYNYTEDFTGKTSRLAHLSRTGKNWRGL